MNRQVLIVAGRTVILERQADKAATGKLSADFMSGFEEGVAELLASLLRESATDILEEIT